MRLLVVDADLLALERIRSYGEKLGHEVDTAKTDGLVAALLDRPPELVVIDLDRGGTRVLEALGSSRAAGTLPERVVGFYSHIEPEVAERAEAAGCRALPRGRFFRTLATLFD
jgi:CheY-like chemotaxis protein